MNFSIVVAIESRGGIGMNGQLPWPKIRKDMWMFKALTVHSTVIMGRKTWESLPLQYRPLPNRTNVVITSKSTLGYCVMKDDPSVFTALSLKSALEWSNGTIYVIGGESIYEQAIDHPDCSGVHLTHIHEKFDCDKRFPVVDLIKNYRKKSDPIQEENGLKFNFSYWSRK